MVPNHFVQKPNKLYWYSPTLLVYCMCIFIFQQKLWRIKRLKLLAFVLESFVYNWDCYFFLTINYRLPLYPLHLFFGSLLLLSAVFPPFSHPHLPFFPHPPVFPSSLPSTCWTMQCSSAVLTGEARAVAVLLLRTICQACLSFADVCN